MIVTLPHALEDFHYGDLARVGIPLPAEVALLLIAYAVQITGIVLTARNRSVGPVLLSFAGAAWCAGAILVHGHDLLFAGPEYRHGVISKLLEAFIIVLGAAAIWLGLVIARRGIQR